MPTFESIIERVRYEVSIGDLDVLGTVAADMTATANTFTVNGPIYPEGSGFTPGVLEVGDELIYVQAVDPTTGTCSGVLRGQGGTTPTVHPAGTPVRDNPHYPRARIKDAINDALRSAAPDVYAVKTITLNSTIASEYELPADAIDVLSVIQQPWSSTEKWCNVRRWDYQPNAGTSTGKALWLPDVLLGRKVLVKYKARPALLVNPADDFETTTGLPDWAAPIAVYGACVQLTAGIDARRTVTTTAVQAQSNDQTAGRGQYVWKGFLGLYQDAVSKFTRTMLNEIPSHIHYTR